VAGEQKPALREIQDFLNFLPSVLLLDMKSGRFPRQVICWIIRRMQVKNDTKKKLFFFGFLDEEDGTDNAHN